MNEFFRYINFCSSRFKYNHSKAIIDIFIDSNIQLKSTGFTTSTSVTDVHSKHIMDAKPHSKLIRPDFEGIVDISIRIRLT